MDVMQVNLSFPQSGQLAADFAAQPQRVVSTLPPGVALRNQVGAVGRCPLVKLQRI